MITIATTHISGLILGSVDLFKFKKMILIKVDSIYLLFCIVHNYLNPVSQLLLSFKFS